MGAWELVRERMKGARKKNAALKNLPCYSLALAPAPLSHSRPTTAAAARRHGLADPATVGSPPLTPTTRRGRAKPGRPAARQAATTAAGVSVGVEGGGPR